MKTLLLTLFSVLIIQYSQAQNINDNKVSFDYIQLPLIKVRDTYKTYETRVEHAYLESNKDSLTMQELRKQRYETEFSNYKKNRDAIQTSYYNRLADWENKVNNGILSADGKPLPKPTAPLYPKAPDYLNVSQVQLNSDLPAESATNGINIQGFKKGLGGSILTINVQAIRNIKIIEKKSGSGKSTKYTYKCEYQLPVMVKFETPTDGVIFQEVILQGIQSYAMKSYKNQYEHKIYMLNNKALFYRELESSARKKAILATNEYLNNQLGYVRKSRRTEIYSVKKFKQYDYSDVTVAYSKTIAALNLVGKDKDHSSAKEKLELALDQWKQIMQESNDYDKKARINDKISGVIHCNIAEIEFWLNNFDKANTSVNLAINSGVLKARSHAKYVQSFYNNSRSRWNVHY